MKTNKIRQLVTEAYIKAWTSVEDKPIEEDYEGYDYSFRLNKNDGAITPKIEDRCIWMILRYECCKKVQVDVSELPHSAAIEVFVKILKACK